MGITHIHALVSKGTLVNDESPAGALGCHTHCLANLKLHAILWGYKIRSGAGDAPHGEE